MSNQGIFLPENFHKNEPQNKIQLTSLLSGYILYKGIKSRSDYQLEAEFFKQILPENFDEEVEAYLRFRKRGVETSFNRYEAIRKEIPEDKRLLVNFACGLSPLSLAYAVKNSKSFVFDSDLEGVVDYRKNNKKIICPDNYQINVVDLLKRESMEAFSKSVSERAGNSFDHLTMVIEGLTFYLPIPKQDKMHKNIIRFARELGINAQLIISYYVSDKTMKEDSTEEESAKEFQSVFDCISLNQKCFFKSVDEVIEYLSSKGYKNVRLSDSTQQDNYHKVIVCDI